MPASIGVNLRVTGNCRQGGRKYMEDCFSVAYQQTEDDKDLEYAFFGIYDGHGGMEAACFAKEHLMETIIKHRNFWSDNDEDVLRAIKDGYIATHYAMWKEQSKWPKTNSGLPSTAGTTASVAFIRRGKIYIGHVGDSGIVLGYQEPGSTEWKAKSLTKDHKPENPEEMCRIEGCGGKVVLKSGVPRVVWNRPKIGHQGPVRRSTPIDEIPFLAVARSLGDLWSYNSQINEFVVSPDPDCSVLPVDTSIHRCLIFGTDGLYNMLTPAATVHIVQQAERHNENEALSDDYNKVWLNPSKLLVERALERWHVAKLRADNTSAVTLMLDPPGPPRAQVLKDRKKILPESGLKIVTRYDDDESLEEATTSSLNGNNYKNSESEPEAVESSISTEEFANQNVPLLESVSPVTVIINSESKIIDDEPSNSSMNIDYSLKEQNNTVNSRESLSFDPKEPFRITDEKAKNTISKDESSIQIHEISSSNIEESSTEENCAKAENGKMNKKIKKPVKRQHDAEELPQNCPRKSLRLHLMPKNENKSCSTLAEDKLKKLAESPEKCRKYSKSTDNNNKNKISMFLRSSRIMLKKNKQLVKVQLNKNKVKMALESILSKPSGRNKVAPSISRRSSERIFNLLDKQGKENVSSTDNNSFDVVHNLRKSLRSCNKVQDENKLLEPLNKKEKKSFKLVKTKKTIIGGKLGTFKRSLTTQKAKKTTDKENKFTIQLRDRSPKETLKNEGNKASNLKKVKIEVVNQKKSSSSRKLQSSKNAAEENWKGMITRKATKNSTQLSLRERVQSKTKTLKRTMKKSR